MNANTFLTTRRQLLSSALGSAAFVALSGNAPQCLLQAAALEDKLAGKSPRDTVLVVVQLSGGNDGLNTVIPFANDVYHKNRPTLAIAKDQVLKINDELGFHPSAKGLADLLEAGRLAILQGVGYPNPNRSHFESMDIWHTCQRKKDRRPDGWLGRFLDRAASAAGKDVPGLHLGDKKQPLALAAEKVRVPSVATLDRFRLQGDSRQVRQAISKLTDAERKQANDLLGFVQSSTSSALAASERVEAARKAYTSPVKYPETPLAQRMKIIAQLIDAGLQTRIYYVELDGFDTHSQQADAHNALLSQWGGAMHSFVEDITHHGHADRVTVLSFSEFGRRVKENASEGTDHGAAAPVFLAGAKLKGGPHGAHPSLSDLQQGDLKHHTDFRQVYAAVLQNWLGYQQTAPVLGNEFSPVDVFA